MTRSDQFYNNFSKYTGKNGESTEILLDNEEKQEIFDLFYADRLTQEEIAAKLDLPLKKVILTLKGVD